MVNQILSNLFQIIHNIKAKHPFMNFRAAKSFWKKQIYEYFNVDAAAEMNDLALILLKGGTGAGRSSLKGVFYRQFLPATNVIFILIVK